MLQNPGSLLVIWFIVFEGSRDRNHFPYAIGDISSDYLEASFRTQVYLKPRCRQAGSHWLGQRRETITTQIQRSLIISLQDLWAYHLLRPLLADKNECKTSFLKPQVYPDSSDVFLFPSATRNQKKIRWVHWIWYDLNWDLSWFGALAFIWPLLGCEESLNESEDVFQTNGMPRYLRTESGARVSVRRSPRKESSVSVVYTWNHLKSIFRIVYKYVSI